MADEYRRVEPCIALLRLNRSAAFGIFVRKCLQDCEHDVRADGCETDSDVEGRRTDSQDDLVTRVLLEVVVAGELLPAERTRLAVVERAE